MLPTRLNLLNIKKAAVNLLFGQNNRVPVDYSIPYSQPLERAVYWLVHILAVLGLILMMIDATLDYQRSPTVTTMEIEKYPLQKVNYPAIAICNINRISYAAVRELAEELMEFETTTYNVNLTSVEVEDMLKLMGRLYHYEFREEENEKLKLLHTILERGYNGYDINRIMKRLAPKCRSMLQRCSWNGKDQVCDDLFFFRRTENGYCCTFNDVRRNPAANGFQSVLFGAQRAERATNVGTEYGLSVLLNPRLTDYAYKIFPSYGFKVLVYSPLDYPDKASGSLREILVSPKTESFLNLNAVAFYSTPDVIQYPVSARNCLFNTERSKIFHGYYSFSDCIVHCRLRDILHVCQCVPFFYPHTQETVGARVCTLKDLECLNEHKARWWTLKPQSKIHTLPFDKDGGREVVEYIDCNCLPSCEDIEYSVTATSIPLSIQNIDWDRTKFIIKNHSIVHVYFGSSGFVRMKQDVLLYWYELMSNYGGICGLFLGVSIINVVEAIYLLFLRICPSRTEKVSVEEVEKNNESVNTVIVSPPTIESYSLYWHELSGPTNYPFSK